MRRQVKFIQGFDFNIDGSQDGKRSKVEGEVFRCNAKLADKLVNHWEVAVYHDVMPSNKQVIEPQEQKATYTLNEKGAGWFELIDEDGDVVDKVRGEEKAQERLDELNG